jgi:hypothetical protein
LGKEQEKANFMGRSGMLNSSARIKVSLPHKPWLKKRKFYGKMCFAPQQCKDKGKFTVNPGSKKEI